MNINNQRQGRGWHGDPERHARAGRKGGKASGNPDAREGNMTQEDRSRAGQQPGGGQGP